MNKGELIQSLYAMEKQAKEIDTQNARLRSIQETTEKLKKEQNLAPPEKPVFQKHTPIKDFDWNSAVITWGVIFLFGAFTAVSAHSDDDFVNIFLLLIFPTMCAWPIGKFMAKKNKEKAYEKEALRIKTEYERWDVQVSHYESRKRQIPNELTKLQSDYNAASQAKQQAQSRLAQYGNQIGLHSHYWTSHALHEIWTLLDRGRADTLKEALNRYEADESQRRHNQEMAYYASEQADAEWRRAQAAEKQAEYARQQAAYSEQQSEYARQQADNSEAVRRDVAKMREDQEWDRVFRDSR